MKCLLITEMSQGVRFGNELHIITCMLLCGVKNE